MKSVDNDKTPLPPYIALGLIPDEPDIITIDTVPECYHGKAIRYPGKLHEHCKVCCPLTKHGTKYSFEM